MSDKIGIVLLCVLCAAFASACGGDGGSGDARPQSGEDAGFDAENQDTPEADVPDELPGPTPADDRTMVLGDLTVEVEAAAGILRLRDPGGQTLLETVGRDGVGPDAGEDRLGGYAPAAWRHTDVVVNNLSGAFEFTRAGGDWQRATTVTAIDESAGQIGLTWAGRGVPEASMVLSLDARGNVEVSWRAPEAPEGGAALASLSFKCDEDERFFGFGSQSYAAEHRGWRVPIWTREQGIVKKEDCGIFPLNGCLEDAYAPMGWAMSSRGYGVLLGRSERTIFEMCSERADAWRIETFANEVAFTILRGDSPKNVLTELTEYTGRMRTPAPWTFAPWNDGLKTPERVLGLAALLRENQIPSSAMWVEDWIGGKDEPPIGYHLTYVWFTDEERWTDLPGLIADLNDEGFEFLGYFNSFVRTGDRHWPEAMEGDFVIKNEAGEPYVFVDPVFEEASLVDLTNPEAVEWLQSYQQEAIAMGMAGWMADFGEWLPFDAVMHDGRSGAEVHNLYPLLWQEANRAHLDEGIPDGDYTFFVRSGFAWTGGGTSGIAPVVWAGDQNTTWDDNDGIATVVPIGLNLGMSGVGVFTHDIAGYTSALNPNTTKELFWRWTELGAFSPVMRTHHGAEDEANWSLDRDEDTLAHWKRYAIEHTRLFPYFMALSEESAATGIPLFRHMFLEFPDDPETAGLDAQFMLGDALLVAPVLEEGAESVEVYLPAGTWTSWWSGAALEGPGWHTVPAPLGEIPVFVRPGGIVPRLTRAPDTLTTAREGLLTLENLGTDLAVRVHGGAVGRTVLEDETVIEITGEPFAQDWTARGVTVGGQSIVSCRGLDSSDCMDAGSGAVRVSGATIELAFEGGPTLTVTGAPRAYIFEVMGER